MALVRGLFLDIFSIGWRPQCHKAEEVAGDDGWINTCAYVDIAGPMLGIPKTIPSLLNGEMRDAAILGELEGMLEHSRQRWDV